MCGAIDKLRHKISLMRQHEIIRDYDPRSGESAATLAWEYQAGTEVPQHAHGSDQLIYAVSGVMEVASGESLWVIPPEFGLWLPARTPHRIRMPAAVSMRTLYFRPSLAMREKRVCEVLHITPLLRELLLEVVGLGRLRTRNEYERAVREVLRAKIRSASPMPTFVRMPQEERALRVARGAMEDAGRARPLAVLAKEAGASVRTIERIFRRETGMDFDSWRRQLRLTKAVELLAAGRPVKEVAFSVGYGQPSAFVEMFRRTFGSTPKAWARELREAPGRPTA
jgi:AraC-like DNA-binding protein/quercetin dioxygenase-like cupin family protein